jgi:hypothetical protein
MKLKLQHYIGFNGQSRPFKIIQEVICLISELDTQDLISKENQ